MTDEVKALTISELKQKLEQDGWTKIAQAIEDGTVAKLTDFERGTLDSAVFGFGVLIDGKRVDPLSLRLLQYGHAPASVDEGNGMETEAQR